MALLDPTPSRVTIQDDGVELTIIVPSYRNTPQVLIMPFHTAAAIAGGCAMGGSLYFSGKWPSFLVPIMTVWLVVWIFCIIRSIQAWLWLIGGREIITVSAEWLRIVNDVYGWRRARDFELATVGNLRVGTVPLTTWYFMGGRTWPQSCLQFTDGARVRRFGYYLEEHEATAILERIEDFRART